MSRTWFYWGGLTAECWSSTLRVEDDRLFGNCGGQCRELLPTDIVEVEEFAFNNPFVLVTTGDARFHVGAMTDQYDDVVRVLKRFVGSDFCHRFVHRWNVFFYRNQFRILSFIKSLFRAVRGRQGSK